jgi:hypothetical protein
MFAPVVLFVYNRLWHTEQTIEALKKNLLSEESDLIIFSDGPKKNAHKKVEEVRGYCRTISGFKSVKLIERIENMGLSNSVISGVNEVLRNNDKIVVLEDDMITSPYFLTYMNDALELYKDDDSVISIHGYIYPVEESLPETFFLKGADCWGWATWKRGWDLFESDGNKLLKELKRRKLTYDFDFYGSYPYTRMLKKQIRGKNDSWAIRWYASAFLHEKLTLYPGTSLVRNIGNDSSGTHSWNSKRFDQHTLAQGIEIKREPLQEDIKAKRIVSAYLKSTTPPLYRRVMNRLKFILKKV